jgi:hypothetical protein
MDPLGPGGVLLPQVLIQLQQRAHLSDLLRRDPGQRHLAVGDEGPYVTGVGLVGLGPLLRAAQVRCLGWLGQQRGDPGALQFLDDEQPSRAAFHRERHIPAAGEPLQPRPQRGTARRIDPAPPHLPGASIQIVEGDLSTVDVKPSYDGHYRDLLTLPNIAYAPSVR